MRKNLLPASAVLLATAGTVWAGGMTEPVMEAEVVEAATVASSHDFIVPLFMLLIIAAAATTP